MHLIRLLIVILILNIFIITPVNANISAVATIDKDTIGISDYVVYKVELTGDNIQNASNVELNGINDFRVMSSSSSTQVQIINTSVQKKTTFTYVLIPNKIGDLEISGTVKAGSNVINIPKVYLTVTGNQHVATTPPNNKLKPPSNPVPQYNGDVVFEAEVDNYNPYEGQQIIYTAYLYVAQNIDSISLKPPEFKDFIVEELDQVRQYSKFAYGRNYTVLQQSYALYPTKPGKFTIPPAILNGRMLAYNDPFDTLFGSYKSTPLNIRTNPVIVYVKELPKAPANFNNSVGNFKIKTEIDKVNLKVGETAKLKIVIWGKGNISNIRKPEFNFDENFKKNFKIYSQNPVTHLTSKRDYIQGQRVFKYDVVALAPGEYYVPQAELSYFDPSKRLFNQLKSDTIKIKVFPGDSAEQLDVSTTTQEQDNGEVKEIDDLIDINRTDSILNNEDIELQTYIICLLLFILPITILVISLFYLRHKEQLLTNTDEIRKKIACKSARAKLKRLKTIVKHQDEKLFFDNIDNILKEYVGDKLNVSAGSLTSDDVEKKLKTSGVNQDMINKVTDILALSELYQYSSMDSKSKDLNKTYDEVIKLINMLEKELKKCN